MKSLRFSLSFLLLCFFHFTYSQVTSVPASAKDNFAKQYPAAQDVEWDNDIVNVNVHFTLDGQKMNAAYSNKGIWKNTSMDIAFEKLPAEVQDGLSKSKYADRNITDVKLIYLPADVVQYRIKAEKNDVEKKYLYFDASGKLLRDNITL
ncbi:MAG: hypothetical protein EOO06_08405 [Chitinophagaceae bacterium]|nr:MAG: hypothetical protein EOO06_08405 [Chitinophagaceae bacterium]